jgi:hypothetical protein
MSHKRDALGRLTWTVAAKRKFRMMWERGDTLTAIQAEFEIGKAAAQHARRYFGLAPRQTGSAAPKLVAPVAPKPVAPAPAASPARGFPEGLPAGHPVTWGALTAGTILDGVAFEPLRTRN